MESDHTKGFDSPEDESGPRELSLLEAFDLLVASIPPENRHRRELYVLRSQIEAQEETIGEARQMIEKLEEVIKKVTSPANRIGTYLSNPARETAHIVVGGADYYCNVDPRINLAKLKKGTRVLVNEAYVIVGDLGFETGRAGHENHRGARPRPAPRRLGTWIAVVDSPALRRAVREQPQVRRRSAGRSELPGRAGGPFASAVARALPRRRAGVALGESRADRTRRSRRSRTRSSCRLFTASFSKNSSTRRRKVFCSTDRRAAARRSSAKRPPTI